MSTTTIFRITKADRDQAKELGVQAGVVAHIRAKYGRENVAERLGFALKVEEAKESLKQIMEESILGVEPPPAFTNLKVLRRCPNPIWILCQSPPPNPVAVQVRVRRNNRLRPGMILQCQGSGKDWKCVHAGFAPV